MVTRVVSGVSKELVGLGVAKQLLETYDCLLMCSGVAKQLLGSYDWLLVFIGVF